MKFLAFFLVIYLPIASMAETLFIEFSKKPTVSDLKTVKAIKGISNLKRFDHFENDYFRRLYQVNVEEKEDVDYLKYRLKKIKLIKKVEGQFKAEMESIIPAEEKNPINNDPFFNYQWSLYNNGQVLLKDIDDTHL